LLKIVIRFNVNILTVLAYILIYETLYLACLYWTP